jgi:ABC-2 type transport system permease protein
MTTSHAIPPWHIVFGQVWRSEVRRLLRDRGLRLLHVGFGALVAYAAASGTLRANSRAQALEGVAAKSHEVRASRRVELEREITEHVPASTAARRAYAQVDHLILPVAATAGWSQGLSLGYPSLARVTTINDRFSIFDEVAAPTESPEAYAAGSVDLAFVIVMILPLVVLAGTFDIWARERASGLEPFLLAMPLSSSVLIAAKVLARAVVGLGPLVLLVVGGAAGSVAASAARLSSTGVMVVLTNAPELLVLTAVVSLYGLWWIMAAAVVNVWVSQAASSVAACGALWLGTVVVLPVALAGVVDHWRPAPSRARLAADSRAAFVASSASVDSLVPPFVAERLALPHPRVRADVAAAGTAARRGSPPSPVLLADYATIVATERGIAPAVHAYRTAHDDRRRLSNALRHVSLAASARDALDRLAGTDAERAVVFEAQADRHVDAMRSFADPLTIVGDELTLSDYDRMPTFEFIEPTSVAARQVVANLLSVTLWVLATGLVGWVGARRLARVSPHA